MSLLGGGGGREYVLKIIADVKDAVKGVDEVATKTSSMKDKMIGVGKGVAAGLAAGAVVEFGKDIVNAAADADDANDLMQAAFGESSKSMDAFAKSAADNMGLSETAYKNMAAKTGNLLQSVGISNTDAAKSTEVLSQRAADMAAIWGGDAPQAMEAINKAMVGSTKGLTAYGIKISAAEVDARAMAKGYKDASGKVTDAGRAIAAQELILEKTANVQGGFAANSKDLGSQQDILKAKFENVQASLGAGLLPIITKIMELAQPIMDFIVQNVDILGPLAIAIGAVTAAMWLWNAAMNANPIGLVVIAIAALVAGIMLAYKKVEWFHDLIDGLWQAFQAVFHWVQENWPLLLAILTGPIGIAVLAITKNWDTIKEAFGIAIDFIKQTMGTVYNILTLPIRTAIDAVKKIIEEIPGAFRTVVGAITTALSTVWDIISYPFKRGWELAKGAGETVLTWFGNIKNTINGFFNGLADVISYPFRMAFDAIKTLWNNTVGKISFTIPSWVPGVGGKGFSFPKMAAGGIVNKPTLALIGEAGPEAVVPLGMLASASTETVTPVNVTIQVYALDATAQTGRRVYDSLLEYARISGNQVVIG
jgi:phage-related protein